MSIVYTGKLDEKVNRRVSTVGRASTVGTVGLDKNSIGRVSTVGRASTVGTIGLDKKTAVNEKGGDRSG